jgi:tetratricopeptide (TPR) repeat protein
MRLSAIVLLFVATAAAGDPIASAERSYFAGDLRGGIRTLDKALKAKPDDPALLTQKGKLLAIQAFTDTEDFAAALATLETAVARAEAAKDYPTLGTALHWLGFARYARTMISGSGTYDEAKKALDRAVGLRGQVGDQRAIAESTLYRGLIDEREGNDEAAMYRYRASLDIASAAGFALEESFAQRHIGALEQKRGDRASALKRMERSLELRRKIAFHIYLPYSLLAVGDLYAELGRKADALRVYREAEALARKMGHARVVEFARAAIAKL